MYVPLPVLILGAVAVLGLVVWALLRGGSGRQRDLIDPKQALVDRARAEGYDEAAAWRIAARGGDDRYEMPGRARSAPEPEAGASGAVVDLTDALRDDIWKLVHTGHTINAIKLVRERTGLGLKEAKDLVEGLRRDDVTLR